MPSTAYQHAVSSDPATQFVAALATNAMSVNTDLVLPSADTFWFIRAFSIVATENLDYELWLMNRAINATGVLATENFAGFWQFPAISGTAPALPGYPVTGDDLFHYYIDGNAIPYRDLDQVTNEGNAKLHLRLINRSVASKSADAAGALIVTAFVAPQGMQV